MPNADASNSMRVYGNQIEYTCKKGHKAAAIAGSTSKVTCQKDETSGSLYWAGESNLIQCRELYCDEIIIPFSKNSSALETDEVGSSVVVECRYGYYIPQLLTTNATLRCFAKEGNLEAEWEPKNLECQGKFSKLSLFKFSHLPIILNNITPVQ